MQIKKIITCFFIMLLLIGCTPKNQEEEPSIPDIPASIYIDPVTEGNPVESLGKDINKKLSNYFGEPKDAFNGESLSLFGKTLDIFDLKVLDYYGNTVDLSKYKDKKVFIEIAATYCSHCGEQLKYISDIRKNLDKDIDMFQIFADRNGNVDYINEFYATNGHNIEDDVTIIQYNYDLVDTIISMGITQTPTFMFIENGIIKTSLSSFNSKYLSSICKIGFTDTIKREEIVNDKGEPIEKFYRTYQTVMHEIKPEYSDKLNHLHESNMFLIGNLAGQHFNWYDMTSSYDDGYIKKESYSEYDGQKTIIFGLSRDNADDLTRDISIINDFIDANKDIKCLIVFLDDTEFFYINSTNIYLHSDIKAKCPTVSSRASVPYQIDDIAYTYISESNVPMILFVENNYITGACVGSISLVSLDDLKNMFFGDNCITLAKNLNRNY